MAQFVFTGTTIVINFGLAFLLLTSADWVVQNEFGLLLLASRNAFVVVCCSRDFDDGLDKGIPSSLYRT